MCSFQNCDFSEQPSLPFQSCTWFADDDGRIMHRSTSTVTLPTKCTIDLLQMYIQSDSIDEQMNLARVFLPYRSHGYLFQCDGYDEIDDKDRLKNDILSSAFESNLPLREIKIGRSTKTIRLFFRTTADFVSSRTRSTNSTKDKSCNICLKFKFDENLGGWFLMPYRLIWIAEDADEKIIGHVFAKLVSSSSKEHVFHGHITSVNVLKSHRKQGIATRLMKCSQEDMTYIFSARYISLYVRASNEGAIWLYSQTLKYDIHSIRKGYYSNGEDAYDLRCLCNEPCVSTNTSSEIVQIITSKPLSIFTEMETMTNVAQNFFCEVSSM